MTRSFRCLSLLFLLCQGLSNCGFFDDPTTSSVSCDPNCSSTVTEKTVTLEGKLAQSYVKHAQVWADQLVGGEGDLKIPEFGTLNFYFLNFRRRRFARRR